jgi:hypothetical protein
MACSIAAPFLYLYVPTEYSSVVVFCGSVAQALVVLQTMLGNGWAKQRSISCNGAVVCLRIATDILASPWFVPVGWDLLFHKFWQRMEYLMPNAFPPWITTRRSTIGSREGGVEGHMRPFKADRNSKLRFDLQ